MLAVAGLIATGGVVAVTSGPDVVAPDTTEALALDPALLGQSGACPPGMITFAEFERQESRLEASSTGALIAEAEPEVFAQIEGMEEAGADVQSLCVTAKRPEGFGELLGRAADLAAPRLAGMGGLAQGAFAAAAKDAAAMEPGSVDGTSGAGSQYGRGPLDTTQFGTASLGLVDNSGRTDDLEYDADNDRLFAAVGTGGIWMSEDRGDSWVEINGNLPATIVGSVAWTPAGGGRLVVVTGDPSFGGITGFPGIGAFWTDDIGEVPNDEVEWTRAGGVPDDALGFRVAVDESDPSVVYVATSKGLYRSSNGGSTFVNTELPTGPCAGVSDTQARPECHLANVVTDVIVQAPGGTTGVTEPLVVASVGWRGGNRENPDGSVQSPGNGIYRSVDGGQTFTRSPEAGIFTAQERIGRIEMGAAVGPDQDHNWLFAMVQDAVALNGAGCAVLDAPIDCSTGIDTPLGLAVGAVNTVLDGVYASPDFGETWIQIASTETFQNPLSGSALNGTAAALGYQPGVQAWYNQFVTPDPTQADVTGAPTRLLIGLEEVWENTDTLLPTDVPPVIAPTHPGTLFRVVGRYFGGQTCGFLDLGALVGFPVPVCPLNTQDPVQGGTTTHPDQQSAVWVPNDDGSVDLFVGNDGGVYRQTVDAGSDLSNAEWGDGAVNGFQTLLPYWAAPARDGRVWMGLQDNGTAFIDPEQDFQQFQTFGGDGFFTAVDPKDSDIAYYETPGAAMSVTTDGGQSSTAIDPPAAGGPYRFSNPFMMDPNDALQLATAGSRVYVTDSGPATVTEGGDTAWHEVFDLGQASADLKNQMSAIDIERNAVYVGFCGSCDILNQSVPFANGIATNVNGDLPPFSTSPDGWHVAAAEGLPNRFITSIVIDPTDVRTVYVGLGGYSRKWASPGTLQDENPDIGEGHVFRSTDGGETFTDWSGNLPDATVSSLEVRGDQVLVGTDVGAFASRADGAAIYAPLEDLPNTPIFSIQMVPHDPNHAIIATYGRGVWEYEFDGRAPVTSYQRLAGDDRVQTAVRVSQEQFEQADTVVLATSQNYADALAAVPLAAWEDSPILLTPGDRLRPEVAAELERLKAEDVIMIGGPAALSIDVENAVGALGLGLTRLAGPTRFDTAADIAELLPATDTVYLVEGADADPSRGWPDALAVGPLAAEQGHPILLATTESVPDATSAALEALGTTNVVIVGGAAAVSEAVADEVAAAGSSVSRISGDDRYATSAALAAEMERANLTDVRVWVARGDNWPDALAAGAAVAGNGGTLILSHPRDFLRSADTATWVGDHSEDIEQVHLLGGVGALAPSIEAQIRTVITEGPPDEGPAEPIVGEVLASYTFDVEDEGWTASGSGVGEWNRVSPGDASAAAWRVEPYLPESSPTLTSPPIDQPGGTIRVDWSMAYNTEECCDFVVVEWSGADGAGGTLLGVAGGNDSFPNFDRYQAEFVAPPGPITLRFRLSSDQLVTQVGAAVDNVQVQR